WEQRELLEPEALRGVVRSLSYGGPAIGPAALERLLQAVGALGEREGREWARGLRLFWLRRGRRSRRAPTAPPRQGAGQGAGPARDRRMGRVRAASFPGRERTGRAGNS